MGDASGFQLSMVLVGALFGVINLFIGIMINHMLQEQRAQRAILREIETKYFPRDEFQRFEDASSKRRHDLQQEITAIKIRMGDWKPT